MKIHYIKLTRYLFLNFMMYWIFMSILWLNLFILSLKKSYENGKYKNKEYLSSPIYHFLLSPQQQKIISYGFFCLAVRINKYHS